MKRFLVFAGSTYYPMGGWEDLITSYDTLEEALTCSALSDEDWAEVVDLETGDRAYTESAGYNRSDPRVKWTRPS